MIQLTSVTYGTQSVLEGAPEPFVNVCLEMIGKAAYVAGLLTENKDSHMAKGLMSELHSQMIAMSRGQVSLQIANGERVLCFVGGEHCKTSLVYAFPGINVSIEAWVIGQ